jgi:hypothetical protein
MACGSHARSSAIDLGGAGADAGAPPDAGSATLPQGFGDQSGHFEVVTHHYDVQRQGVQYSESRLNPSNVANMALRATANLGTGYPAGQRYASRVYAQPLYARNVKVGGVRQNVVYVADTWSQIWYFTPTLEPIAGLPGGNPHQLDPQATTYTVGVMGTPVIDEVNNRMYVVDHSTSNPGDPTRCPGGASFWLHVIDLDTMLDGDGVHGAPPVQICTTVTNAGVTNVFQADRQWQRPALLHNGPYLYIAFGAGKSAMGGEGGTCQHGWVMTFDVSGAGPTKAPTYVNAYLSSRVADTPGCPDQTENFTGNVGIWMAGGGPAADPQGNVYLMTSNGVSDPNNDGNSLVRLTATGERTGSYVDPDSTFLTGADLDFGSSGPMVVDVVAPRVVTAGKLGTASAISTDAMQTVPPSDVLTSSPEWHQIGPANCSSQPMCDDNGVPNGGPNVCCPYGCDDPDPAVAWSLIQGRIASEPQPLCQYSILDFVAGNLSNPVFWNNRIYFWPQSDYLSFMQWDPVAHSFANNGATTRVGNVRIPYYQTGVKQTCTFGMPNCQVALGTNGDLVLSVNQDDTSSALVFAATWRDYDTLSPNRPLAVLYAFDANAANAPPLWTATDVGYWQNFTYPIVANGGVYVVNAGRQTAAGWWPPQLLLYY